VNSTNYVASRYDFSSVTGPNILLSILFSNSSCYYLMRIHYLKEQT